jgi:ankyrin repeat protein
LIEDINQLEPETDSDAHQVTFYTGTALHRAVESDDPEHVRFLMRRGADRTIKGAMGMTPLEVAERKHLHEIANILRYE